MNVIKDMLFRGFVLKCEFWNKYVYNNVFFYCLLENLIFVCIFNFYKKKINKGITLFIFIFSIYYKRLVE